MLTLTASIHREALLISSTRLSATSPRWLHRLFPSWWCNIGVTWNTLKNADAWVPPSRDSDELFWNVTWASEYSKFSRYFCCVAKPENLCIWTSAPLSAHQLTYPCHSRDVAEWVMKKGINEWRASYPRTNNRITQECLAKHTSPHPIPLPLSVPLPPCPHPIIHELRFGLSGLLFGLVCFEKDSPGVSDRQKSESLVRKMIRWMNEWTNKTSEQAEGVLGGKKN